MHDNFFLKGDIHSPKVSLSAATGILEISGESTMNDPLKFYAHIIHWLDNFLKEHANKSFQLNFHMLYFNTGTSKAFFDIFKLLESHRAKVIINWIADPDETDIQEDGECFKEDFPGLQFNILERKLEQLSYVK